MATANTPAATGNKNLSESKQPTTLASLVNSINVRKRFDEMLGKKAPGFLSSLLALYNNSSMLQECDPMGIIAQAAIAASLDLPINPSLGFAAIVPYRDGQTGRTLPQFQMMWRGFVQLGIRSGEYAKINASAIYADELKLWNPVTSDFELTDVSTWKLRYSGKAEPIGYMAFFRLKSGFEKYIYMTTEELIAHGKKYSKSFQKGKGKWATDFNVMALKTPIKLLLSKFGPMSIEMQTAIRHDQASVISDGGADKLVYPDNPKTIEGELVEDDEDTPKEMANDAQEPEETAGGGELAFDKKKK